MSWFNSASINLDDFCNNLVTEIYCTIQTLTNVSLKTNFARVSRFLFLFGGAFNVNIYVVETNYILLIIADSMLLSKEASSNMY